MNTYPAKELLEEHKLDKSYWGELIIHAEWAGGFTEKDIKESSDWFSCACGKLDRHIAVNRERGYPIDDKLFSLGIAFVEFVEHDKYLEAACILINIHDRSIELLGGDNE